MSGEIGAVGRRGRASGDGVDDRGQQTRLGCGAAGQVGQPLALVQARYECPTTGEIVSMVDETAGERLDEYERCMAGRRQLTWSRGRWDIRAAAGLEEEQTEEEIVAEELEGEAVAVIPGAVVAVRGAAGYGAAECGGAAGRGRRAAVARRAGRVVADADGPDGALPAKAG